MGDNTVKIRPDQPLFKADAIHMPLWIHAPFELLRGALKWLTCGLMRDNPHRNKLDNPTFTKAARKPHRLAFWTGRPVVKRAKWKLMAWRWGLVFTVLILIKYLPASAWLWLARGCGRVLRWVGLDLCPWLWAHLGWLPFIVAGVGVMGVGLRWVFKRLVRRMRARAGEGARWFDVVLAFRSWIGRRLAR